MAVIERPRAAGLLTRCSQRAFSALDVLKIPAGALCVVDRAGALEVYREGDQPRLQRGLGRTEADVYFVDLAITEPLEWGAGNLAVEGHTCGAYGTLRLAVSSERRLVTAFRGQAMPVTAQQALAAVWGSFAQALRQAVEEIAVKYGFEARNRYLEPVAERATLLSEEVLEQSGLAIRQLFIEEIVESAGGGVVS